MVFNTFVFLQLFNAINMHVWDYREVDWRGVLSCSKRERWWPFGGVLGVVVLAQVLIVQCGSLKVTNTHKLNAVEWGYCVGMGVTSSVAHQWMMYAVSKGIIKEKPLRFF